MTLSFISNYINHHQIPFCDACYEALGDDFHFIQTMPMEAERRAMGWEADALPPYVIPLYEDPDRACALVREADVALVGWAEREDLIAARMEQGKPTVRVTERIYREGRWRMVSPRGLVNKYKEHIRYRQDPLYLLAIGAYTTGDFKLLRAYPGKMYRWGYFPPMEETDEEMLFASRRKHPVPELVWAGRFMDLKHPEYALRGAALIQKQGIPFHLTMIGDGEKMLALQALSKELALQDAVRMTGFQTPEKTRELMRQGDILLFTSNHLEGWGAVVSEAMGAGLAVLAGDQAGAPPVLIEDGRNGLLYHGDGLKAFLDKLPHLVSDRDLQERLGRAACHTIRDLWNAKRAAEEFLRFCDCILKKRRFEAPSEGPMSPV